MPTCLYCSETKDPAAFNKEHVLPDAFGRYEPNSLTLVNIVCQECNTYFGNNLDLKLSRDSIEGLDRYEHELSAPSGKTAFGRADRLRATVNNGGFYQGAQVWWGPSQDGSSLHLYPFPQFGFSDATGRQVWFPKDELPAHSTLPEHGFARGREVSIKPFGIDQVEAERLLAEKGYPNPSFEKVEGLSEGPEIDIYITGTIDRMLWRAVAKIAFNYLAYHYEGIARMPQFDAIRRYVRYDENPSWTPVGISTNDFVVGLPDSQVPIAHGVGVSLKGNQVIGQVTLFFRFHYRIILADGGFLIRPSVIDRGHLFNPKAHQIVELTSDPRRGRPMPAPPTTER